METKSLGFIGGGRITKIFLHALMRKNLLPAGVIVNEPEKDIAAKLAARFPGIKTEHELSEVINQEYIFISLHPPVFIETLSKIKPGLKNNPVIISLAPKITISQMEEALGGYNKIVRMNPNAPSIINEGFNPVTYSSGITEAEKAELSEMFKVFGNSPEVEENKLEAYALITAMGPTYFWFQFYELKRLAEEFGLSNKDFREGFSEMIKGSLNTMDSELECNEIADLVPVKPIGKYEEAIRGYYNEMLPQIFNKIKPVVKLN